jgi:hypothetical protein
MKNVFFMHKFLIVFYILFLLKMDNLQLSPAKLFYFITELSKKGLIDEKERI